MKGHSYDKQKLQAALKRAEGQVRGIARMVDDDRYCIEVLTQISATRAALDRIAVQLLDDHVRGCVIGASKGNQQARADEMMDAVERLLHS